MIDTRTVRILSSVRTPDDQPLSVDVPDSSGGINTRQQDTEIANNQLTVSYNADLSSLGIIKKRLGSNSVLNDLGALPINALIYLKAPSVDARMTLIYGKRMYKSTLPLETSGSWTDIDSTDHFTENQTSTVAILAGEKLFFSNGTDNVFSYDGTSITDEGSGTTDPPKGRCLAYFKNRLWVANLVANPDYVYYSDALDPQTFDTSVQLFRVNTGDSSQVTNMIPFQGSSLIIFKEDTIHELVVSGDTAAYWNLRPLDEKHGCVAPECAQQYDGRIYYLSRDGVRVLPAEQVPVSYFNKTLFDTINWTYINRARAVIWDDKYWLAVPTGSSEYPDKVFVLDLNTKGWTCYTGINVGCWGIWIANNAEILMYGDANDGVVYQLFKSTQFNDGATKINFQIETKAFDFGQPFLYKNGGEIELEIGSSTGNTVTVSAAIDGGSYTSLGTCTATDKFHLDSLGKFRSIKFKFQNDATSTQQLILNGFRVVTFPEAYWSE